MSPLSIEPGPQAGIIPLGHERYYLFLSRDKMPYRHENAGVFSGKMCSDRCKNHGCGREKLEGTSSGIFGVATAAKCCELKRCADRVRSRTDNNDEVLGGKLVT